MYVAVEPVTSRRRRQTNETLLNPHIVANLTREDIRNNFAFTVGDNKTYGGYQNSALEENEEYDISVAYAYCNLEVCATI